MVALPNLLTMMPRTHHQIDHVIVRVLWLYSFPNGRRSINIFLVPEAVDEHHRHFQRLRGNHLVHRLVLPKFIVRRMVHYLFPKPDLVHPALTTELADRSGTHERVVI